jgi:predicted MPP superfamily phosphohydrolase
VRSFFLIIVSTIVFLNLLWWFVGGRLAQEPAPRWIHASFMTFQLAGLAWLFLGRMSSSDADRWMPKIIVTAVFVWHMLVLPLVLACVILALPVVVVRGISGRSKSRSTTHLRTAQTHIERRRFLAMTTALAPALLTLSLTGLALKQLRQFRIRRMTLRFADLPPGLHGITIAQVSDIHVGRFTSGQVLQDIVRAVNELGADLVLHTGDLINDELADLDHGIELVRAMQGRYGSFLIEGNHDLIENPEEFERRVRASGIPFLLDESQIISVRGVPLQLLGLSWTRAHANRDEAIAAAVDRLLQQRKPDVFPILMAHHPHAFDAAARARLPLTLSGHTHGGQLMLNEREGFGPALFHYWSGLYRRGDSNLIVSNGVGNWFPLRIHAPAEIIHLTLERA